MNAPEVALHVREPPITLGALVLGEGDRISRRRMGLQVQVLRIWI